MEIWNDSKIVYDGAIVRLRTGHVRLDDGRLAFREVVEHPGGVCIAPFTGHSVILERQYRIALQEYVLEAPAGKLEADAEDPEARVRAELEEETGYLAGTLIKLGVFQSTVGFCSERMHLYLGLDLVKTQQRLEPDERIELIEMPLEEVRAGLKENRFTDAKTALVHQGLIYHLDR